MISRLLIPIFTTVVLHRCEARRFVPGYVLDTGSTNPDNISQYYRDLIDAGVKRPCNAYIDILDNYSLSLEGAARQWHSLPVDHRAAIIQYAEERDAKFYLAFGGDVELKWAAYQKPEKVARQICPYAKAKGYSGVLTTATADDIVWGIHNPENVFRWVWDFIEECHKISDMHDFPVAFNHQYVPGLMKFIAKQRQKDQYLLGIATIGVVSDQDMQFWEIFAENDYGSSITQLEILLNELEGVEGVTATAELSLVTPSMRKCGTSEWSSRITELSQWLIEAERKLHLQTEVWLRGFPSRGACYFDEFLDVFKSSGLGGTAPGLDEGNTKNNAQAFIE